MASSERRRLRKQRRLLRDAAPALEAGWAAYRGFVERVPGLAAGMEGLPNAKDYDDLSSRLLSIASLEEVVPHPLFRMRWVSLGEEAAAAIFARECRRDLESAQRLYFEVQRARQAKMGRSHLDNFGAGAEGAANAMADILGPLQDLLAAYGSATEE